MDMQWRRTANGVESGEFTIDRYARCNQYGREETIAWNVYLRGRVVGTTTRLRDAKALAGDIEREMAGNGDPCQRKAREALWPFEAGLQAHAC
jgi:hypothetical protein